MKNIIFILCALTLFAVYGQNIELNGNIADLSSRSPLAGANIYLKSKKIGTTSNSQGQFNIVINQTDNNDTLVVEFLGYKKHSVAISDYSNNQTIYLIEDILSSDNKITVYGEKFNFSKMEIPHLTNIIDAKQIKIQGAREISDVFKIDPSIRIEGNELDGKTIQVRGSDADEVNIYLDGILLNNVGNDNIADLSVIPSGNIEKIEIIKGANLGLLGSGAFGGVINITSQKKRFQEYKLEFKYGSAEKREVNSEINLPISDKIYLNYYGAFRSMAPEVEFLTSEQYDVNKSSNETIKSNRQNHYLNLDYNTEVGQITAKLIGYVLDYDRQDWNTFRKNLMLATAYKGSIFSINDFDFGINYTFNDDAQTRYGVQNAEYVLSLLSQRLNLRLAKNFVFLKQKDSEFNIQFLGEYNHDEIFNSFEVSDNSQNFGLYKGNLYENRTSLGGVATFVNILDSVRSLQWKTFLGYRGEFLPSGKSYRLSTFGIQVDFSKSNWILSPYFSFGDNLKIPSLQDNAYLLNINDIASSYENIEKLKLIPENTTSKELGLKLQYIPIGMFFDNITLDFAWYYTRIFNKLLKERYTNVYIERQIGEAKIKGIEGSFRLNNVFKKFNLTAAFGVIDVNNLLLYAYKPESKYSLQIGYQYERLFTASIMMFSEGKSIAWVSDQYNNINIKELKSFQDMDISLAYNFILKPIKINVNISANNIFDSAGFQYYYLKKRFFQIGLGFQY